MEENGQFFLIEEFQMIQSVSPLQEVELNPSTTLECGQDLVTCFQGMEYGGYSGEMQQTLSGQMIKADIPMMSWGHHVPLIWYQERVTSLLPQKP